MHVHSESAFRFPAHGVPGLPGFQKAFANLPADFRKTIEYDLALPSSVLDFWKEHTQMHVKVLLEGSP